MDNAESSIVWQLGAHLAAISVMAIGGGAIILAPDIQRYVVDVNHWLTNDAFVAAYTLAQVAPGPNMLFVTLVGWYAAGMLGAITATAAIVLPPALLVLLLLRLGRSRVQANFAAVAKASILPLSVGLLLATGISLAQAADHSTNALILTLATVMISVFKKMNPLWLIAIGAAVGVAGLL